MILEEAVIDLYHNLHAPLSTTQERPGEVTVVICSPWGQHTQVGGFGYLKKPSSTCTSSSSSVPSLRPSRESQRSLAVPGPAATTPLCPPPRPPLHTPRGGPAAEIRGGWFSQGRFVLFYWRECVREHRNIIMLCVQRPFHHTASPHCLRAHGVNGRAAGQGRFFVVQVCIHF